MQANSQDRGRRAELGPIDEAIPIEDRLAIMPGVVTNCLRLNVRKEPKADAEVIAVIDALSEVMIEVPASYGDFYKVCTAAGIEGFCMKKYIALRE